MGRLMMILACIAISFLSGICNAQVAKINLDQKTILQVEANTTAIITQEEIHNLVVDSIKEKQSKLSELLVWIAENRRWHQEALKNIKGWGEESKIYKKMYSVGCDIVFDSARAISLIGKSNLTQKAVASIQVAKLVTSAISTGKVFADIVTNSTVRNPVQTEDSDKKKGEGDKHNLLNRDERVTMANKLLDELKEIDRQLMLICYMAKYSTLDDLIRSIDCQTWYSMVWGKLTAKEIIRKWNGLKN